MKLQVLIVDDDLMSRKALERMCQQDERLDIAAICDSATAARDVMAEKEIDLLLLDVEMPEMNGIELLHSLPVLPQVIFTTSKAEYAADAFEFQAIDFLKKPITPARFSVAIEKAVKNRQQNQYMGSPTGGNSNEIYIRENGRFLRLNADDILYFENVGDYVRVKTNSDSHIIHGTMKGLDEKITDPRFFKVHRSYIVNLHKIKDIEEGSLVIERTVIPISRAHRAPLLAKLNIL